MSITLATDNIEQREIIVSRGCDGFTDAELAQVVRGAAAEDMAPITIDTLRQSYASMGMYALCGGARELIGYARQVRRNVMEVDVDEADQAAVVEIGSVWVAPGQRGKGVGKELIRNSSRLMKTVGFLPVAVCNDVSRRTFEAVGFEPIAEMTNDQGKPRVIEVDSELPLGMSWLCRAHVISRLREIDRFEKSKLLI